MTVHLVPGGSQQALLTKGKLNYGKFTGDYPIYSIR